MSIVIIVIVILLSGTAYLVYVNRNHLLKILQPSHKKKLKSSDRNTGNAMIEVCQDFLMYADSFQGIFETMYKASLGVISHERLCNVLKEWDIRMGNIGQAPFCLKSWWATVITDCETLSNKELQERAQLVIQMIQLCNIIRDDQIEIVAKDDTNLYYQDSSGNQFESGQKLRIESPCWYLNGNPIRIIDKGYCEIV